jgi:hypothetical protein
VAIARAFVDEDQYVRSAGLQDTPASPVHDFFSKTAILLLRHTWNHAMGFMPYRRDENCATYESALPRREQCEPPSIAR